ncbi:hypothetical protein BaRGS_00020864 [Batillaria attramentaria]|uniref:Tyrosine-protein phosphatase domain-containing protein n=1 Tax=Batillaria attramentaria TaxID=370345 RepID=A0ABD0KLQ6_9CAEN
MADLRRARSKSRTQLCALEGVEMMDSNALYNLLQQTSVHCPRLSDPNFLLLYDARQKEQYEQSHILTARLLKKKEDGEFAVPYEAELECKENIVVYDGKTKDLRDTEGGYEEFSRLYTFLRSEKVIFMPRELDELKPYPYEIIQSLLYVGNWEQGTTPYILKDLHIEAFVCITEDKTFGRKKPETNFYRIYMPDSNDAQIAKHFPRICDFLDTRIGKKAEPKQPVLVFDKVGFSLSGTIVMAYLMNARKADVDSAWKMVKKHLPTFRPNRGFVEQLSVWEITVCGATATDIGDPRF